MDDWREWRAEADGITWRVALSEDIPSIERMWRVKQRLIGKKETLPDLFKGPVVIALVAEDEQGWIVDGVFIECVADITKLSGNPHGFKSLTKIQGKLASFLGTRGFRRVTAAMTPRLSEKMGDGLRSAGFDEQQLCLWQKELHPALDE